MLFTDAACEVFMDIFSPSIWAVHCRCDSFRPQGYFISSNWMVVHAQDLVFTHFSKTFLCKCVSTEFSKMIHY